MKLPISWLNELVNVEDIPVEELQKKLFDIGFEVEEVINIGKEIFNVVVGQITKISKHQDSNHLQICFLNCAEHGNEIQIVTGAQNVFEGAKVPVALDGATLAGGIEIKKGKLRGVESNGMLCSGQELGIDENFFDGAGVDGILILPNETQLGADIKDVIGLNDVVFDLSITANRPDCQSILGIAREVSAAFDRKLIMPNLQICEVFAPKQNLNIKISENAHGKCQRYLAGMIQNVKISKSPAWLRRRLALCDISAKNNIVDLTNYVLLEFGQPMHAFDYLNITGEKIIVRAAEPGEKIKTLDQKLQNLEISDLVICDAAKPIALAGIMGGENSEITENTTTVVFESATFAREGIRKTSRRLGLSSDSSRRYEKGVDVFTTGVAAKRVLALAEMLGVGEITNFQFDSLSADVDKKDKKSLQSILQPNKIVASVKKINALLGIEIPASTMQEILSRLNFETTLNNDCLTVIVPEYRTDVSVYQDLAEEIIRIYGYSKIKPTLMKNCVITQGGLNSYQKMRNSICQNLVAQGMHEIKTYSFYSEKDLDLFNIPKEAKERQVIKILNPINEDLTIMRRLLAPSMLATISKNIKRGIEFARFFELANIYIPNELPIKNFPEEKPILCLGAFGEKETFFTIKGCADVVFKRFNLLPEYKKFKNSPLFLHPNQSAEILINGDVVGYIGALAYDVLEKFDIEKMVFVAEIDYNKLYKSFDFNFQVNPISKFPEIKRDLSFVAPQQLNSGDIEKIVLQSAKHLTQIKLFDVYQGIQLGDGKKSLTYRLTFSPEFDKELTHGEVDAEINEILINLKDKLNLSIRTL